MTFTDPEQAILDHLAGHRGPPEPTGPVGPAGWVLTVGSGSGPTADLSTVRFRRRREFEHSQMHAVSFLRGGRLWRAIIRVDQDADGRWSVHPVGSGSGSGTGLYRKTPWVNFTAQSGDFFAAGGDVSGAVAGGPTRCA